MREIELPGITRTGMEPWALFGEAMALSAHARYAAGDDIARGEALFRVCRAGTLRVMTPENPHLDYPASEWCCSPWGLSLLRWPHRPRTRCGCSPWPTGSARNRMIPTMRWERDHARGRGSRARPACPAGGRVPGPPAPGLLTQARLAVERLPG